MDMIYGSLIRDLLLAAEQNDRKHVALFALQKSSLLNDAYLLAQKHIIKHCESI